MTPKIPGLRSPADQVRGLRYFARMVDKIRLNKAGTLPAEYQPNLGSGFDERCVNFLRISYKELVDEAVAGGSDEALLEWAFKTGRRPDEEEIEIWNEFMRKRGWKDEASPILVRRKTEGGFEDRDDIETMFQFIDADEGRL